MSEQRRVDLHLQQLDELSGAALRALADKKDLHYRNGRAYRGDSVLRSSVPHLVLAGDDRLLTDLSTRRALADAQAVRLRYSDTSLFESQAPDSEIERMMFDWLEQIRAEAASPSTMPGQRNNLRRRFERWSSD